MKIKHLFIAGLIAFSGIFALTTNNASAAFNPDTDCPNGSLYKTNKGKAKANPATLADCNLPADSTEHDLVDTSTTIINVIVGVIGIIAVFVIVLGGIFFVTSTGDAAKIKRAQHAILYGVVGLVIAILAFAIVNFVLKSVF